MRWKISLALQVSFHFQGCPVAFRHFALNLVLIDLFASASVMAMIMHYSQIHHQSNIVRKGFQVGRMLELLSTLHSAPNFGYLWKELAIWQVLHAEGLNQYWRQPTPYYQLDQIFEKIAGSFLVRVLGFLGQWKTERLGQTLRHRSCQG